LEDGEELYAEAGSMMLMKGDIKVRSVIIDVMQERSLIKGLLEALGRKALAGETVFHNVFRGPGEVWLTPGLPGGIEYVELSGDCWTFQDYSYLAHHGDVKLDLAWKGKRGLHFGDLVWLEACGSGGVWVSGYGYVRWVEVPEGEEVVIDNMHFVALPEGARWEVEKFGDLKSFLFGGEGYVVKVRGPTRVLVQTRILPPLAVALARFMPGKLLDLIRPKL